MRGNAIGLAVVLASATAWADVRTLTGELGETKGGSHAIEVPLDARGWVVEARFAVAATARVDIEIVDDRLTARFMRLGNVAILDGESYELPESPTGMHVYRIEAAAGRRLLLVDGQVVIDHDQELPPMALVAPTKVSYGASVTAETHGELVHWQSVVVDTAPAGLAVSGVPFKSAIAFSGAYAPWLYRVAGRAPQIAPWLAQLQLPEQARACVVFDLVAAISTPRPKHYRPGELAKLPKGMPAEPAPQIDFDLIETPVPTRQARKPMMRRRAAADVRAQVALFNATKAKDPRPFYERAIEIVVNESGFQLEALTFLQAVLPDLAKHPDACR